MNPGWAVFPGGPCGHHRRRRQAVVLASTLLALPACSPSASPQTSSISASDRAGRLASATGAPLPAASPWLRMQDSRSGVAVWPSGAAFLLIRTVDGWRHVTNITPIAVPTGGGLSMAMSSGERAVAALPFHQLVDSPLLRGASSGTSWSPGQLPGGVTLGRDSIGLGPRGFTAVLRGGGGTAVAKESHGWSVLTDASQLAPGAHLHLDALRWGVGGRGWLTGHGAAGTPKAFTTGDSGRTWAAVGGVAADAVAALAPCGGGRAWTMPVVRAGGTISITASADGGATWAAGAPLTVPRGAPAWGCHNQDVWILGGAAGGDHVYSSANAGRTWTDRGVAPGNVTDLEPTGNHTGFATTTTAGGAVLWDVRGDGASFSPIVLPGWVANVGNQTMSMN
jgi:hypothetical protein